MAARCRWILFLSFVAVLTLPEISRSEGAYTQWVQGAPGVFRDMAVDAQGNVYVTGYGMTTKYDGEGNVLWSLPFGSHSGYQGVGGKQIQLNAANDVYLAYGGYSGPSDLFLFKVNTNGTVIWQSSYGTPGTNFYNPIAIALDNASNLYVAGYVYHYDNAATSQFLLKYDNTGNQVWQADLPYIPTDIAVDRYAGDVYVVTEGCTMRFDGNGNMVWSDPVGGPAIEFSVSGKVHVASGTATVTYNREGQRLWTAVYTNPDYTSIYSNNMTTDSAGNVYVIGSQWTSIGRIYLVKYDTNGNQVFANTLSYGSSTAYDVAVDNVLAAYVNGYGWGGTYHMLTAKFNADGSLAWSQVYPGPGETFGKAIAIDGDRNVFAAGDGILVKYGQDSGMPVTTIGLSGTSGKNGWYVSDVVVSLSAVDAESGVAETRYGIDGWNWTNYTAPFTISSEGQTVVSFFSIDLAWNIEPTQQRIVNVDKTSPIVTGTDPGEGAVGVPTTKPVVISFTDAIAAGSAFGSIRILKGGKQVAITGKTINGNTLTINHANLSKNSTYKVILPAGAVENVAGIAQAAPYTLTFTTGRQ